MLRMYTLPALCAALLLFAAPAAAQDNQDVEKAKAHYMAAEQAMKAGDYRLAATEYNATYEITQDPALFFKVASAHEKAGNCADALVAYRRYLAEGKPDEQLAAATEERIQTCEAGAAGAGAEGAAAAATGEAGTSDERAAEPVAVTPDRSTPVDPLPDDGFGAAPPSFADTKPSWQRDAGWISVGVAVGFVTAGTVLAMSASSQEQDLQNLIDFRYPSGEPAQYTGNVRDQYEDLVHKGQTYATWSRVLLGVAGASAAAATVFFVMDAKSPSKEERSAARVVPVLSPESVGVAAGWRF